VMPSYNYISIRSFTHNFTVYGPDPEANSRLKALLLDAKRQGFPKEGIETAIKRGQGLSTTGKPLDSITVEAMFPSGAAAIIECLTESKAKTLMEVRQILTKHSAQASPTQYLFKRRGSVILKPLGEVSVDSVMECALEVEGFEDMVEEENAIVELISEPNATKTVANTVVEKLAVEVDSLEILWQPVDYINVSEEDSATIFAAVNKMEEITEVRAIYLNIHRAETDVQ